MLVFNNLWGCLCLPRCCDEGKQNGDDGLFVHCFILFECKSSHIFKYGKGKWGMSVNLCRFAKNLIQDIEI